MKVEFDINGDISVVDFNQDKKSLAIQLVNGFKNQLISMRNTTSHREELEWEIRLYDYILEEPEIRFKQYQDARFDENDYPLDKRIVAKNLGWIIK